MDDVTSRRVVGSAIPLLSIFSDRGGGKKGNRTNAKKHVMKIPKYPPFPCFLQEIAVPVNSKLDWNDNLAAIFEAKLVINRLSSSILFYCFSRRG